MTEKSTALSGANKYIFEVDMRANKPQIKEAVEKAFNVTVTGVNVMVMKGKSHGGRRVRPAHDLLAATGRRRSSRWCRTTTSNCSRACSMPIQQFKPTSPGRRGASGYTFDEITKKKPEKSLVISKKRSAGRNNRGKITVRHRGGGARRKIRIIDFKRDKFGVPGRVAAIEYDPGRTARIALIFYRDGEKRYILAPDGPRGRGDDLVRARRRRSASATRCRCATCPPARWCTTSS